MEEKIVELKKKIEDRKNMIKFWREQDKKEHTHRDLSFAYAELCELYAEYVEFLISILKD